MRQLNAKQKKLLAKFWEEHKLADLDDTRNMTTQQLRELNEIYDANPHETFWQNANRYTWDEFVWKEVYG